uniref:Putative secreted protein n=1 Tax=Anopheles darlingi TaxID=43151 RepID=A0A2M4DGS4_ANODA
MLITISVYFPLFLASNLITPTGGSDQRFRPFRRDKTIWAGRENPSAPSGKPGKCQFPAPLLTATKACCDICNDRMREPNNSIKNCDV